MSSFNGNRAKRLRPAEESAPRKQAVVAPSAAAGPPADLTAARFSTVALPGMGPAPAVPAGFSSSTSPAARPCGVQPGQAETSIGNRQPAGWHGLPEALQIVLAQEAMRRAAAILAEQAELLAHEMDEGTLVDHGGSDALRLFAAIIRSTNAHAPGPAGNA